MLSDELLEASGVGDAVVFLVLEDELLELVPLLDFFAVDEVEVDVFFLAAVVDAVVECVVAAACSS